jgi:hypothetical protein
MEIWKQSIFNYEVSNFGNIRKCRSDYSVKRYGGDKYTSIYIETNTNGYYRVKIKKNNYYLHHLVAKAFLGDRPNGECIDHINRDRKDNRIENLRYISFVENIRNGIRIKNDIDLPFGVERDKLIFKKYQKNRRDVVKLFNQLPFLITFK